MQCALERSASLLYVNAMFVQIFILVLVPEFFWLVTGLPSVGMLCWKMCTVSWTVCRCRHTSKGSMQVETFWARRYRGSDRNRLTKADAFSRLRPGKQTRTQTQSRAGTVTE